MTQVAKDPGGAAGADQHTPAPVAALTGLALGRALFQDQALEALEEVEDAPANVGEVGEDPDLWADLMASRFLRAHRAIKARADSLAALRAREIAALEARFDHLQAIEARGLQGIETALLTLAKAVTFPKGKKSRKVGYGSYGLRTQPGQPAKLQVNDKDKALAWLREHAPDLVLAAPSITYSIDKEKTLELAQKSEVIPEGIEIVPPTGEEQKLSIKYAGGSDD